MFRLLPDWDAEVPGERPTAGDTSSSEPTQPSILLLLMERMRVLAVALCRLFRVGSRTVLNAPARFALDAGDAMN
jgi:hypothetical protein